MSVLSKAFTSSFPLSFGMLGAVSLAACLAACSAGTTGSGSQSRPGTGGAGVDSVGASGGTVSLSLAGTSSGGSGAGGDPIQLPDVVSCGGPCADFPATPILVDTNGATPPPADVATRFAKPPGSGAAPCLLEPEPDSLYPRNWLRVRFVFKPADNQDLFELRIHSDQEKDDLLVYSRETSWYMPKDMWTAISSHVGDEWAFTVSVRSLSSSDPNAMPSAPATTNFSVAPSTADGSIVYWTTSGGSALKGFAVGDETVVGVMTPPSVNGKCIGCHTSTPDGEFIGMSVTDDATDGNPAYMQIRRGKAPNDEPSFLTPSAKTLLARKYQEMPVFSKAHWTAGDHFMLSMLTAPGMGQATQIIWTNLEATATDEGVGWGNVTRLGDSQQAGGAAWSHDGATIAYSSAAGVTSGVNESADGNIFTVPFALGKGGTATPLTGASDPAYNEYYPAFAADDKLLAITRVAANSSTQNNPAAEVLVVPTAGGSAQRLAANDPPQCSAMKSPGVTNSWAKWSPQVQTIGGKSYYWLIFSSERQDNRNPQLYATGIVSENGVLKTHGALYLWNQPIDERNHTPAWDLFQIPPTPEPPVVR